MKHKSTFIEAAVAHVVLCKFTSGNTATLRIAIPSEGGRVRSNVKTAKPMTKSDQADCDRWLESVRQTASRIAGQDLALRNVEVAL